MAFSPAILCRTHFEAVLVDDGAGVVKELAAAQRASGLAIVRRKRRGEVEPAVSRPADPSDTSGIKSRCEAPPAASPPAVLALDALLEEQGHLDPLVLQEGHHALPQLEPLAVREAGQQTQHTTPCSKTGRMETGSACGGRVPPGDPPERSPVPACWIMCWVSSSVHMAIAVSMWVWVTAFSWSRRWQDSTCRESAEFRQDHHGNEHIPEGENPPDT